MPSFLGGTSESSADSCVWPSFFKHIDLVSLGSEGSWLPLTSTSSTRSLVSCSGCLEEYSSSPHTIGTGRYYESHWKDGWNDVIDILEQVAARNQHLQRAEETCTSLRVRSLLRTAIDDALFASPCDDRTIRVGIPDFGDSWPRYHAAVGSYHYGAVQKNEAGSYPS